METTFSFLIFAPVFLIVISILSLAIPRKRRVDFVVEVSFVALAIVGLLSLAGCATPPGYNADTFFRNVAGRVISGLPQVDSPAARQLGFVPEGQNWVFSNSTSKYGRVLIYKKDVGFVPPGGQLIAQKYYDPLYAQIPITVVFYDEMPKLNDDVEKNKVELSKCVGAVARVFSFSPGQPGSVSWTVRHDEIVGLDGRNFMPTYTGAYKQPDSDESVRIIEMPRESKNGLAVVQFANITPFTMVAGIDGYVRSRIPPCHVFFGSVGSLMNQPFTANAQLSFTDRGRLVGKVDYQINVPSTGVLANQRLVTPPAIQR